MLADIGIGIFSAIIASKLFQTKITLFTVIIGIVFALLPDMDFLIEWIKRKRMPGKFSHEHRNLFHLPFLYVPIGSFVVFLFGWIYLFIFVFNSFLHFLHDSFGIGWGIKWIYPFSERNYKFFTGNNNRFSKRFIISWNKEELQKAVEKYGDPNWIKNTYFRPTLISITEAVVFLISIAVLFLGL
ncbi:metal-dependent hydrolase [Patescibacteria group bacterium]|nr:metal-dependent hydrolase [Patescibacteria group bacterium]